MTEHDTGLEEGLRQILDPGPQSPPAPIPRHTKPAPPPPSRTRGIALWAEPLIRVAAALVALILLILFALNVRSW